MSPLLDSNHLSPTGIRVTPAACPICGSPITTDETFSVRECGHAALRTASGVLVSATDTQASRDRIGRWAYAPVSIRMASPAPQMTPASEVERAALVAGAYANYREMTK